MIASRREFLLGGAAAAIAATAPATYAAAQNESGASKPDNPAAIPGRDTTLKFNPDGTRRPFAGNTTICHLPAQCRMRDAMTEFHDALMSSAFRNCLGLTSLDSYHMTVFPGANDQGRQASGWPSYVPFDATIEQCSAAVQQRMQAAQLQCELPFRVAIDVPATLTYPRACTLRMKPVNAAEEAKLRSVRDQISQIYGFRLPDHATYEFHVTMSYQVRPFSETERRQFEAMRRKHVHRIVEAQPVLELGNPEYCTFPDMFRFEPKLLLRCS